MEGAPYGYSIHIRCTSRLVYRDKVDNMGLLTIEKVTIPACLLVLSRQDRHVYRLRMHNMDLFT